MSNNNQILKRFLQANPFLEGIVLSDKEGVEITSAFVAEDSKWKTNSVAMMYVAAITSCNDNLQKLSNSKAKSISLVYDQSRVYIENWPNIILTIFGQQNANVVGFKVLAMELREIYNKYNDVVDKQQK